MNEPTLMYPKIEVGMVLSSKKSRGLILAVGVKRNRITAFVFDGEGCNEKNIEKAKILRSVFAKDKNQAWAWLYDRAKEMGHKKFEQTIFLGDIKAEVICEIMDDNVTALTVSKPSEKYIFWTANVFKIDGGVFECVAVDPGEYDSEEMAFDAARMIRVA